MLSGSLTSLFFGALASFTGVIKIVDLVAIKDHDAVAA
jgi:hypothetical protein